MNTPTTEKKAEKLNIDLGEVRKFEQLANRWWDRNSEFRPLHDINPLRTNYIDQRSPLAEKKVLDVGCGGGILCESMAQRGSIVNGIDAGETPLTVARLHSLESGVSINYRQITAEELVQIEPEHYDIVTCLEMLEHVPDPSSVIKSCAQLCKPGGNIYFSTINRNPKSYAFAILGAEYFLQLLPKGTHEYAKFIRPSELSGWARTAGLELQNITGMTYNPLTKHYKLSETDVDVNYIMHFRKT